MKRLTKSNKKKRGAYTSSRKRLFMLGFAIIGLFSLLIGTMFPTWTQIYKNKKETELLSAELDNLLEEEASLQSEVTKLEDPDYIARYAREKYLYSKQGELILRIPGLDKEKDE